MNAGRPRPVVAATLGECALRHSVSTAAPVAAADRRTRDTPHHEQDAMTHSAVPTLRSERSESRLQKRTRDMHLMPEALARAHILDIQRTAQGERRARRLVQARRLKRRAERLSLRARRALALALM